jgi:hypothetical protein
MMHGLREMTFAAANSLSRVIRENLPLTFAEEDYSFSGASNETAAELPMYTMATAAAEAASLCETWAGCAAPSRKNIQFHN